MTSRCRRLILLITLCRGVVVNRPVLARIMEECEALSHYERSAALAVFHGDLRAAVQVRETGVSGDFGM